MPRTQWAQNARSHRRQRLLLVLRSRRAQRQPRHPVRRAERGDHRRHRRRARGGVPAAARRQPRVLAAHRAVPRQHVGAAGAGRAAHLRAVRGRQPHARARARCDGGARSAGGPHQRPRRHLLRLRRHPRRVRRPVLPDAAGRGDRPARRGRRRHHGGDPGSAVLHPRREPVVRRPGLHAGQHDRLPRGGAGPRARDVLCGNRFGDRPGCGHRVGSGCHGRRRVRRVREATWCRSSSWCTRPSSSVAQVERTCTHCLPHDGVTLPFELP